MNLPKLNNKGLLIIAILIVIVAASFHQAGIRGLVPDKPVLKLPQPNTQTVISEENAVIDVTEKTSPSVIAIGVSRRVINPFDPYSSPKKEDSTIGTGFVVSDKGIILTNRHVVDDSSLKYTVITKDGQKYDVKRIYKDPTLDLALVETDQTGLKALELGDSSKIKVGQTAIAIGNALGRFTNTVTTGVVSGVGRRVVAGDPFSGSAESLDNLIQTDAAINPGNSGGPLLNSSGQVIGLNVATTEGAQNIGFAIPINSIKPILTEFLATGTVSRPFLGIRYRFISQDVAIFNEVPQGAFIQEVVQGGPAEKAGVRENDIITKINNQVINSETKIAELISQSKIGDNLQLTIYREGKEFNLSAIVGNSPQL
jgi:serine protease Do